MVNMLQRKVFRDVRENLISFIAIVGICTLGISIFAGLNLYINTIEDDVSDYYLRANLADYWIYKAEFSESDIEKLQDTSSVRQAELRKMAEGTIASGGTIRLHSVPSDINILELTDGELLGAGETDTLLLDNRFAAENGINPGDTISMSVDNGEMRLWNVKGLIRSVEYIYYVPYGLTVPEYKSYGFAYVNTDAVADVPYNEMLVDVSANNAVTSIRETLDGANIIGRQSQGSVSSIQDDIDSIKSVAMLLSFVFFLTAALVTLITVGRMMDNQRQHLGTLLSIGFPKREITGRYAIYGIMITVPSMVLGWFLSRLIANIMYYMGTTYYDIAESGIKIFSVHFILPVVCVAAVTGGAAFVSCRKSLKNTPAALMRPKPPAQGHRILLERITPFWRRLSFSGKMVTRNMFRNRTRLVMGLVGIIGSSALLVCGFGLSDSVNEMQRSAFEETMQLDMEAKLKKPVTTEEMSGLLPNAEVIDMAMSFTVYINGKDGDVQTPYLVILNDDQTVFRFSDEKDAPVALPDSGALITPRMARALGVDIGGTINVERLDGMVITLTIAAVVDFPVGNEIYMSKTAFSRLSDMTYTPVAYLIKGKDLDADILKADSHFSVVETKEDMAANMKTVMRFLQTIQVIFILFAGGLAFAVMMVLGRLNYYERIRELATLKVLGFRKNEMKRLVLRENIWITLIGLPFGLIAGFRLLDTLQQMSITPSSEPSAHVSLFSFAAVVLISLAFTLFVNFLMSRKFRGIDMVASLKSVE